MTIAEDFWLRGQAAQRTFVQFINYNTAFFGTATLQAMQLGVTVPTSFWTAMARASGDVANADIAPVETAEIVPLKQPEPAPAPAVAEPAPAPVEMVEPVEAVAEEAASDMNPLLLDEPRGGKADDLTELTGLGPKMQSALNEFGIYHFDQLAGLNDEGIAWLNAQQKGFAMTCKRFDLVTQAQARL